MRLTAPRRPRKATAMGLARTFKTTAGPAQKPARDALSTLLALGRPLVMGILNVTPDSFSDGGRFIDPAKAIAHAGKMAEQGADILDIGAESTRPYGGATPVSADDEKARLSPVLPAVLKFGPAGVDRHHQGRHRRLGARPRRRNRQRRLGPAARPRHGAAGGASAACR